MKEREEGCERHNLMRETTISDLCSPLSSISILSPFLLRSDPFRPVSILLYPRRRNDTSMYSMLSVKRQKM